MVLTLGARAYDLATRALVMATDHGEAADLVEVPAGDVERAVRTLSVPVAARVRAAEEARDACRAGALLVVDINGLGDEATIRAAAEGGAAIIGVFDEPADPTVLVTRARAAEAVGMAPACILLSPALPTVPGMLAHIRRLASLGYPLVYPAGDTPSAAAVSTAVVGGCRVIRTADVRTARRVCDVLAAVLEALP